MYVRQKDLSESMVSSYKSVGLDARRMLVSKEDAHCWWSWGKTGYNSDRKEWMLNKKEHEIVRTSLNIFMPV